ncbi:hypothetical protein EFER_3589 [Escherichia fergusonii ATCC 35469]|uniref:Uncharacterized protein n=1 Tax=Escherichia fergusonii (strain ATCC 35469 / DSM 13698 / CCUG 18766 / IAM 14443 / JCM 21226 / LMG 7866 / NBRC 102419 / NCTC 12128 / CDC 0568-73) TaxID=585054 RepID=B7LTK2_ESCF3|nr:hypothetical protein EFER_3589 [Escherichia fergusonii ATCC 35469]
MQVKISCDADHKQSTNLQNKNVSNFTFICHFWSNLAVCGFLTQHYCDDGHTKYLSTPYIYVIKITQKAVDWTVDRFSARFRTINKVRLPLPPH